MCAPSLASSFLSKATAFSAMAASVKALLVFVVVLISRVTVGDAAGCASESFSNRVFAACSDLPQLSSSLHWKYDASSNGTLKIAFVAAPAKPDGWVAWAINPSGNGMVGSQALIAFKQSNGAMVVKTYDIKGYDGIQESPIAYKTSDLAAEAAADGRFRLFATLVLGNSTEASLVRQVWQVGPSVTGGVPDVHAMASDNKASVGTLDLVKGVTSATPSVGPSTRSRNVHGVLNVVSWGILLPIGAIFARYLRVFKSADPAWFYLHVSCQVIGYGVGVSGWATGLNIGSKSKGVTHTTHRNIGITLFALCTLQVFALLLRPKKDHKYRLYWNLYHHSVGYTVIILGIINIFKGLDILDVEQKWRTAYIIVIAILAVIALALEVFPWIVVLRRKSRNKPHENGHYPGQQRFGV